MVQHLEQHLLIYFFLVFPELKPEKSREHYIPRVFGFKLHPTWHQRSLDAARQAQQEFQIEQKKMQQQQQQQQRQGSNHVDMDDKNQQ